MEFYLPNIAFYLMALLVSSVILFAIGRTLVCLLSEWRDEKNAYQTVLNSFLLGYTSVLPLFAIVWSRGNSLFWLAIILWLFYVLWWRKPCKAEWFIDWRTEIKVLAIALAILTGCFAMLYYFCFVRSEGQIFSDQIYASNLTQSILTYHNEAYFRTDVSIAQTYHWGDSWTTALWSFLFCAKPLYVLYCVTYPFFLGICILGITTITKGMPESFPTILCLLLGILYFFYWNLSSFLTPWHGGAFIAELKNYLMIVFMAWGISHIIKNNYAQGFFAMLLLVVYYSPMAAGVLTLVCLLSFFINDKFKLSIQTIINPYVIGSVVIALCYGLFYVLQPDIFTEGAFTRHADHSNMWVLGFIIKRICRPIVAITPIAIITGAYICKFKKETLKKYVTYYLCTLGSCFVACVVGGFATKFEVNAGQIATNFYGTVSSLFVFVSLIYLLNELTTRYKYIAYATIVVIGIAYPAYFFYKGANSAMFPIEPMSIEEKEAYASLQTIFAENPVEEMGYMRNYMLPENRNNPKTEYDLYFPMDRLVHILPNGYHPYCLSAYDMPEDIDPMWNDMAECELWQYGAKLTQEQQECTKKQIIRKFITQRGINYILVEKGAKLPEYLMDKFEKVFDWDDNVIYYAK